MKLTLYMAITANGYIATQNHGTDWVCDTDWAQLERYVENSDAIVMGRKTMEVSGDDFPYGNNKLNVVLTTNKSLHVDSPTKFITDLAPNELLEELEKRGLNSVLLIGGGIINASFLKAGVIDEVILSVHPLILGRGINLFKPVDADLALELISIDKYDEDLIHLKYKVKKNVEI